MRNPLILPRRPQGWSGRVYPMPAFARLTVSNIDLVAGWYREALGFEEVVRLSSPAQGTELVHLRWGLYADLLVVPGPQGTPEEGSLGAMEVASDTTSSLALYFGATELDSVVGRYMRYIRRFVVGDPALRYTEIIEARETAWNTLELEFRDPAGHRVILTAPKPANVASGAETFTELVARMGLMVEGPDAGQVGRGSSADDSDA